jgi:hypothetical protein
MLKILQEHLTTRGDLADLQRYIRQLGKLRARLLEQESIEDDLLGPALEIARRLRSHFLGFDRHTNPRGQLT